MKSDTLSKTGFAGSLLALFAAVCCVLPVALMAIGLGGSWVAIFGKVAAASYWIAGVSALLIALAWAIALRANASRDTRLILGAGTVLTLLAWCLILNEKALNDFLIAMM